MTTLHNARVVTAHSVLDPGWVEVVDATITEVGAGRAADREDGVDLGGSWVVPGFIDLHVHGGGGHDAAWSPEAMAAAVAFHRAHGTTRSLVSLVAAPIDDLERQLGWIADLAERGPGPCGHVVGAHLEGPFLAHAHCGAQNPAFLLPPDRAELARLVHAARGWLRVVTIAPELTGGMELIADIVDSGAIAAVGHTDADYDEARAAFAAGASLVTHLCNGMTPLHHRAPGVVGAALQMQIAAELINDGVHVHPAVVELIARAGAPIALVTDAIAAAGMPDGPFALGGQDVEVRHGEARLVRGGSLAGSTLTMDVAFRRAVVDSGWPITRASRAASGVPAAVLGMADRCGAIAAGLAADLVVLDDHLRTARVMAAGQWCEPAPVQEDDR